MAREGAEYKMELEDEDGDPRKVMNGKFDKETVEK